MSRPASGRRPDSLFDNRYRYDYIYPRGRSGETLRAYDTLNADLPVVIKRPALQDAPPMRAGQEVSILNEKRALERLSGHPVLTELRHAGTFRVGGQTHQYIAMDMAQGVTVESLVLELAARGQRLPELEMLIIFDDLLDLLQAAHDHKIVYNDVDAKHLFWDRATYRLKVIDWGNAVFLDSESVPPHTSRATDILQTGQLIYFVLSGGRRPEVGRADTAGDLGDEVSPKLKAIINKAVNPDLSQRYADIAALRNDLAELRRPLEKNRDSLIERVRGRLPGASSQEQLEQLRDTLHEALQLSPGFPPAVALLAEVETRLKQLAIQGDLDAVRIYMSSGNMGRASSVLDEIAARAGDTEQPLLSYLLEACVLLQANLLLPLPAGFAPALDALFQNDVQAAGRLLVTTPEPRASSRLQQFLLAERLTVHMPGVVLLRPHLVRLEDQLSRLSGAGPQMADQLAALRAINAQLDAETAPGIQPILRVYHSVSDALLALGQDLKGIGGDSIDSPSAVAARAQHAADHIVDLLDVVMQNVLSDPSRAGNALWHAGEIDPANPAFEALGSQLNAFHARLDQLKAFAPASDGSDIADFLVEAQTQLRPYASDITDPRFQAVVKGIDTAISEWTHVMDCIVMGGRRPAITACRQAADAIRPLNAATARWFDDLLQHIEEAPRVEHLSPNATLGRALAEGWEAWDRGRSGEAQGLGEKALAAARNDGEKRAARRLLDLSEVLGSWLANDGPSNPQRTDQAEERVMALLLPEEDAVQRKFSEQMPNMQIYLKAMVRGVVEPMREMSAAAVRALFLHYVLRGMLALQQEKPDEANFWKEAASKALNNARLHPAFQALDTAITRRQLVLDAVQALNNVRNVEDLPEARQAARAPLASAQLEAADQAMRALDDALRRWPDGEFRAARQLLDTAVERIGMAEAATGKDLTPFKTWLQDLAASAEVLQQARRTIEQAALVPADDPDPAVAEAHQKLVDITRRDLGDSYAAQLRQWRDTYNAIRDLYVDESLNKADKLHLLDRHFQSLFIDRQPALPIFRHWQSLIQRLPDPPLAYTPPTFDTGRVDVDAEYAPSGSIEMERESAPGAGGAAMPPVESSPASAYADESGTASTGRTTSPLIVAGVIIVLVIAAVVIAVLVLQSRNPPSIPVTPGSASGTNLPGVAIDATNTLEPSTLTFTPTNTEAPTITKPPDTPALPPTITRVVPTPTNPTATPTAGPPTAVSTGGPSATQPPTLGPGTTPGAPVQATSAVGVPTLPPDATGGDYDVLKALETFPSDKIPWNKDWFGPGGNGWQFGSAALRTGGGPVVVRIGPDVLTPLFGADAARHLTRVDATVELVSYDRSLLPTGLVAFGVGLESLQGQRASVQAMLVQTNVLSLGMNLNGRFISRTQLPVTTVKLGMSVRRNSDGSLSLYVDNQLVGQSNAAYGANSPLTIYLFTSASGVVVNIAEMTIHLE